MKSVTALFCRDSERYVLNPFPTTMLQPSRRRSIRFDTFRLVLRPLMLGCSLVVASACASMFKITPEDGAATATKPAAAPKVPKPKVEKPPKVAKARKQTMVQLALAWVLRRKEVTSALIGVRTLDQLKDCLGAVGKLKLGADEIKAIDAAVKGALLDQRPGR